MTRAVRRYGGTAVRFVAVVLLAAVPPFHRSAAQDTTAGKKVYERWCAGCHGDDGAGDGPAANYMLSRPRDFTRALYQVRLTATGQLPLDEDLLHAIDAGLPGTAMPGWKPQLSDEERRDVMAYVKTFSAFFADTTQRPERVVFGKAPSGGADAIRIGRQFYDSIGCRKCHGDEGRGDGRSARTLKDDFDQPMFAADLTESWRFNGGSTVEDIYRRLRTGLDGTPMPTFSDLLEQKFLTEAELWRVAQYVHSLSPEREPEVRDVIHAPLRGGPLPVSPDDTAWARVERYYFPLVGQVIRKPRWFSPAVDAVWVQAVHNGEALALRVAWHDRSQSPDTAWLKFAGKVLAAMVNDDSVAPAAALWPDQVAVQFPLRIPQGMERPYFFMGSEREPVYQWRWTSAPRGALAGLARGVERFAPLATAPAAEALGSQATYDHGEWRVVLTRALATADSSNQLQFATSRPIPVAFFAWDGSNGEHGARMAISAWYFLALDEPTSARVFISPVVAMALTLGLGLVVVWRAQRRV